MEGGGSEGVDGGTGFKIVRSISPGIRDAFFKYPLAAPTPPPVQLAKGCKRAIVRGLKVRETPGSPRWCTLIEGVNTGTPIIFLPFSAACPTAPSLTTNPCSLFMYFLYRLREEINSLEIILYLICTVVVRTALFYTNMNSSDIIMAT